MKLIYEKEEISEILGAKVMQLFPNKKVVVEVKYDGDFEVEITEIRPDKEK